MTLFVFALLLAQDKGIVEGVVLNAVTNEPVRKAHVVLDDEKNRYAVTSGSEGKFRFEGIEPGNYHPEAQRQGFFDSDDEPWLTVASGQQVNDAVIKLMPEGVIAGHVVDEDGDPVPGAGVSYERSIQMNGRKVSFESGSEGANSEGYFFIGELKAGLYYLSASPPEPVPMPKRPGDSAPEEDLVSTDDPVPVQLGPGAALRNVEIRMKRSLVYRVRGHISNLPKEHGTFYFQKESGGENHAVRLSGDKFEVQGVPPGSYLLSVSPLSGLGNGLPKWTTLFCRVPVTVSDHNVDDVAVEMAPGPNIEGTIRMDGGGKFDKPPSVGLQGGVIRPPLIAREDGTFAWENLAPHEYWVTYMPPDGAYLKSIQFNHQPVSKMRIDLSPGTGGTLEMLVSPKAATVSGVVHDANGNAARAMVVLWNESTSYWHRTDANGAMQLTNLAPGEYRIAAWERVESAYLSIPEFRARFDAQKITLAEGSHENVELKAIPKSASDAEIAKLQ
jgi:hypothetical protein